MVKVRGCNIFPALIEECIAFTDGCSSEYQVYINNENGRDNLNLYFESDAPEDQWEKIEQNLAAVFKAKIGMTPLPKAFHVGDLPRSEKKTKRIFDDRY